jgi:hypothetical protein
MSDLQKPPIASMEKSAKINSAEYRRNGRLPVAEPKWTQIPRNLKIGGAMVLLAALIGPAVFAIAAVEQRMLAQAVNLIERDPSCSAPIAQSVEGPCRTLRARLDRKYIEGAGWDAVYHAVVTLPGRQVMDIPFVHAPTLYRRMHERHPVIVRLVGGDAPYAVGVGDASAAAGDGPLLDERETWSHVRFAGVTMMYFEVLVAALYLAMKHVRRAALPAGQNGLWI